MKRSSIIISNFLIPVIFLAAPSAAQEKQGNCAVNLKEAQSLYQAGIIEEIPALLTGCISSGFTREEKIQAYKLLINAYIFDNNTVMAEESMLLFLQAFPEYEIIATDPNEFTELMSQFDNHPRISLGILAGGNVSFIRILESIGTHQSVGNPGNYKPSAMGFQAGLMLAKNITGRIEFNAEAVYKQTVYSYSVSPDANSFLQFTEKQSYIQIPVSGTYTFIQNKFSPYARFGFLGGFLLTSGGNLEKTFVDNVATPVSGEQINMIEKRNRMNYWMIIGGGIRYRIPKAYLRADIRYNLGLKNQVSDASWADTQSDLEWKYGYRDSKTVRDDLAFNIGYVRIIYNPRKK
jgi:hypothetical protein